MQRLTDQEKEINDLYRKKGATEARIVAYREKSDRIILEANKYNVTLLDSEMEDG